MSSGDCRYVITVDATGAVKAVQDFDKAIEGLGNNAPKAGAGLGSMMKTIAGGIIGANLAVRAFDLIKDTFADSIKEAADYEKSVKGLEAAFEISGRNMPGMVGRLRSYADQLQALGLADDGAILKAESLTMQLTSLDEKGIKQATRGAIGLSSVFGMDLSAAAETAARAMEGNYIMLGRMIPAVRNATTDQGKHAAMIKSFEGLYSRAIADTQTYSGQVKTLGIEWHETEKKFGEAILSTGILQKALKEISRVLQDFGGGPQTPDKALDALSEKMGGFSGVMPILARQMQVAGAPMKDITGLISKLWESFNTVGERATLSALATGEFGEKAATAFSKAGGESLKLAMNLGGLHNRFTETGDKVSQLTKDMQELGAKGVDELQYKLKVAERAEAAFVASGQKSPGVLAALHKAVVDTQDALMGANFELDRFGHLVPKGSQIVTPFKDIAVDTSAAVPVYARASAMMEILYGDLGRLAWASDEYSGTEANVVEITTKANAAFTYMTKIQAGAKIRELKRELDAMIKGGATAQEIERVKQELEALGKVKSSGLNNFIQSLQLVETQLSGITNAITTGEEIKVENWYKKRLDYINKTVSSERKKQKAIEALEAEYEIKKTAAKRKAAIEQKAVAMMETVVNTASAIVEALPNIPLAIACGIMGAAQEAIIASQPIPLAKGALFDRPTVLASGFLTGEVPGVREITSPEPLMRQIVKEETRTRVEETHLHVHMNIQAWDSGDVRRFMLGEGRDMIQGMLDRRLVRVH